MVAAMGAHEEGQRAWQIWIDRGGTFTDIVARRPDGELVTHKLLSENPERYRDAALQGIRELLRLATDAEIPASALEAVKMGTTVATNALLERNGDRTLLVTTRGFRDALRIAYQNRPHLFTRQITLPELLYERVVEAEERVTAQGEVLTPLDPAVLRPALEAAYGDGIRSVAIVFMHGYRYSEHERQAAEVARDVGFTQISTSHEVSPLMKLVSRGDTTVVDAYLSPILRRYVDQVASELGGARLMFMQSNGGLTDAGALSGQGLHPLRPGRRYRRRGADRGHGRHREDHHLRYGRHLHRRGPLRRRVRARLRDPGGRRAHACADDADPYRRRRRRLDPAFRRRPLPGGSGFGRGQPGTGLLPARRAADGDRLQRHARAHRRRLFSPGLRAGREGAIGRGRGAREVRRLGRGDRDCHGRCPQAGGGGHGLPPDRHREHGQRHQEDLDPARLRCHRLHLALLRRSRRSACLRYRRHLGHDADLPAPLCRCALGLRHGPGGHPGACASVPWRRASTKR